VLRQNSEGLIEAHDVKQEVDSREKASHVSKRLNCVICNNAAQSLQDIRRFFSVINFLFDVKICNDEDAVHWHCWLGVRELKTTTTSQYTSLWPHCLYSASLLLTWSKLRTIRLFIPWASSPGPCANAPSYVCNVTANRLDISNEKCQNYGFALKVKAQWIHTAR